MLRTGLLTFFVEISNNQKSARINPVYALCSNDRFMVWRYSHNHSYNSNTKQHQHSCVVARSYHGTLVPQRSAATVVLSLSAVAASAKAAQYAVQAYNDWKMTKTKDQSEQEIASSLFENRADKQNEQKDKSKEGEKEGKRENIFESLFNLGVGSKYYEGGFEEKMTRREAALILGVRETSTTKRVKEAHRKLLVLNHPDTGGSTYLAGKINEAKELLLKGRRDL